jgi:uncharacterized protein YndB with AHSA1/START domain
MDTTIVYAPVRKSIRVMAKPERAFQIFTAGMHGWWPADHSLLGADRAAITLEPRRGGRWFERAVNGSECQWGHVLEWEPPHRVLLAWQLDGTWQYNANFVTEVEVRFIADGADATRVELEHRNIERYGEQAEATRASLDSAGGWTAGLERFAAFVGKN